MKHLIVTLAVALAASTALAPLDAQAKRLGGGKTAGMQRQMPTAPAQHNNPVQPATPSHNPTGAPAQQPAAVPGASAMAGAAAAPAKRSWLGPLAGLAAGIGLAALASHFGFGAELANLMTGLLLVMGAFALWGWWRSRKSTAATGKSTSAGWQMAGAGAGAGGQTASANAAHNAAHWGGDAARVVTPVNSVSSVPVVSGVSGGSSTASARNFDLPPGFDLVGFERTAKLIFLRMQEANDAGQVEELRKFTTPELFASLRLDVMERSGRSQRTEVPELQAQVVDTAKENGQSVITVRYSGRVVEDGHSEPFDELWHLTQPLDGSRDWLIAGIQQH